MGKNISGYCFSGSDNTFIKDENQIKSIFKVIPNIEHRTLRKTLKLLRNSLKCLPGFTIEKLFLLISTNEKLII